MSIYAIADLHLSLAPNVDKPMDIYGSLWENHADKLREEWEKRIRAEDTVLIPGDISWALKFKEALADLEWIHGLPGQKVLIKGNHELWWGGINKLNSLYDDMFFLQNTFYEAEGAAICGSRGWICPDAEGQMTEENERIYRRELIRLEMSLAAASKENHKDIVAMLHFPPTNDRKEPSGFTELFEKYGVKTVLYGHLHGRDVFGRGLQGTRNGIEYKLVSFDYLKGIPMRVR